MRALAKPRPEPLPAGLDINALETFLKSFKSLHEKAA
jgi:hypothetical protein